MLACWYKHKDCWPLFTCKEVDCLQKCTLSSSNKLSTQYVFSAATGSLNQYKRRLLIVVRSAKWGGGQSRCLAAEMWVSCRARPSGGIYTKFLSVWTLLEIFGIQVSASRNKICNKGVVVFKLLNAEMIHILPLWLLISVEFNMLLKKYHVKNKLHFSVYI